MHRVPVIIRQREIPSGIDLDANLDPLLQRIYLSRKISSKDELDYGLKNLPSPMLMKSMSKAVALVTEALEENWKILIIGDFDADGATSTCVMLNGTTSVS